MKKLRKMPSLMLVFLMLASVFMPVNTLAQSTLSGKIYAFDENGNEIKDICNLKNVTVGVMLEGKIPQDTNIYLAVYSDDKLINVHTKKLNTYDLYTVMPLSLPGTATQKIKAFVWDGNNIPLSNTIDIGSASTAYINDTQHIQLTTNYKYASSLGAEGLSDYYISVYNYNVDKTNTIYTLDENAKMYVNGKYLASVTESAVLSNMKSVSGTSNANLGKYYAPNSGTMKLIDTDNDGDYDEINVKSYETVIVDEAYLLKAKISIKNGNTVDLTTAEYSITMDGNEIDISDLKEWDVLSVAMSADKTLYEIIGTRKTVRGTIDEIDAVNGIYKIYGTEYKEANLTDPSSANLHAITPGDGGIFYIDAFSGIAYFNRIISRNYGFITEASDYYYVGDNYYNIEILDKYGNIYTYSLADNVKITEYGYSRTETSANVYNNYIKALAPTNNNGSWLYKDAVPTTAMLGNYAARLVTYTVNDSGKISAIAFADTTSADVNNFSFDGAATSVEYHEQLQALGHIGITEDTVVFSLPIEAISTKDDFSITSIDALGDGNNYDVAYFDVNEDGNAGAIVITNCDAVIGSGSSLAVVTNIMTDKNNNAETVYNVTFLQDGEEKTLTTTADVYNVMSANYTRGDVFEYAVNSKGEMCDIAFGQCADVMLTPAAIATINPNTTGETDLDASYDASATGNAPQYVFGAVYSKSSSGIIQIANIEYGYLSYSVRHKISDDANIVVVDLTKASTSSARVQIGEYADIQSMYFDNWGRIDPDRDVCVLLKYYKDEVTDVIVYIGYAEFYGGFSVIW